MGSKEIRAKYGRLYNCLGKPRDLVAILVLASYVAQIQCSILVGCLLLETDSSYSNILIPLVVIFIGTRFRGLNNIVHECSHFSFAKKKQQLIAWQDFICTHNEVVLSLPHRTYDSP